MKKLLLSVLLLFAQQALVAQADILETYIQDQLEPSRIPGVAAVVFKETGICWEGYFGMANFETETPVSDSTIFMLASVSKTLTGTAVVQLHDQGYFELDDPINDYLPFEVKVPNYPDAPITFRHLLNHLGGIRDNWNLIPYFPGDSPITLDTFLYHYLDPNGDDYSASQNFYNNAPPGQNYHYSNVGYTLLGYLVEVISGQPFNEYCNANLFDPMEMYDARWFLAETDTSRLAMPYYFAGGNFIPIGHYGYTDYPDGQLRATARDLAHFLQMLIYDGTAENGNAILSPAAVELMTPSDFSGGLTWFVDSPGPGYNSWEHDGGDQGVTTVIGFNPNDSIGIVILTNGEASLYAGGAGFWEAVWDHARSNFCEPPGATALEETPDTGQLTV
ncbi:MAG: beta-lactamase family protein, partial [Phaeodactylibacter sp.]|nr:beta-lactamase family protein [Phaeodactylibacter sp.]